MTQKAVIVRTGPDGHDGLEALNIELERGWTVAEVSPMGGAQTRAASIPTHAALVILERRERRDEAPAAAVAALEEMGSQSEQAVEQVVEDVVDGNGTDPL